MKPRQFLLRGLYLLILLMELSVLWVGLYRWVPVPLTPLQVIRAWEGEAAKPTKGDGHWVDLEEVSATFGRAVVASEDQRFCQHFGLDVVSIQKAWKAAQTGKRLRGASTISQQTAKNVFLWPGRSWLRKGLEVWFTFWIEVLWGKARILEVYLNVIETGPGLYGVDAWSWFYFNREAHTIRQREAALMAVCLPNPRRYTPQTAGDYLYNRRDWVLRQIRNQEPCTLGDVILFP